MRKEAKRMLFKTDLIRCIGLIGMVEQHPIPKKNRRMIDAILKSVISDYRLLNILDVRRLDMQ